MVLPPKLPGTFYFSLYKEQTNEGWFVKAYGASDMHQQTEYRQWGPYQEEPQIEGKDYT